MTTIAVTGATGQLGHYVIEQLKQKVAANSIVALVRNPAKAAALGVTARQADYAQADALETALTGVNTLVLISSSEVGQRAQQHSNVIQAAKNTGVQHIIYTSLLHADTSPLSLAEEHRTTEAELKASGLTYTILRNGWYTENYLGSVGAALEHGALIGSAGQGRIASATREDFAAAIVAVATSTGHANATYELAGDSAWTLSDLATEVSKQSGKTVVYNNLPEAEYAKALAGFGLPEGLAQAIASWDVGASQGALFSDDKSLSKLIGRPTTPLATAVERALNA
ncbi:SDR family oxidoreductase [Lampropedia puyangensis]|uniref:SDR family oxidoreductase n=1 Tax=Lampropedia puyangensis TaxID=1330072 RepID=A0A4S8F8M1_9BURK|nr:SDR family oxidoreductase [Lampropedia puyangensis]THU02594.1 SDR family oxidoreductase [Lampropedia puyangensis]